MIAPDRPGYGFSSARPERTILDWPRDVSDLMDRLSIARFGVLGVSGAVPYVLACALELQSRVSHVAILSGMGPLDNADALTGMNRESMVLYTLAVRSPRLGRIWMRMLAQATKRSPMLVYAQQLRYLPQVDRELFQDEKLRDLRIADFAEAFRQGADGAAQEAVLHVSDWGFSLNDVTSTVFLWQGGLDRHHPPVMGRLLAEALPNVELMLVPDAGGFGFVPRMDAVFDALLAQPALRRAGASGALLSANG
jgi:pimeloyl-ACP methyl ester carboxylesterase